jgi:hypothetical protein
MPMSGHGHKIVVTGVYLGENFFVGLTASHKGPDIDAPGGHFTHGGFQSLLGFFMKSTMLIRRMGMNDVEKIDLGLILNRQVCNMCQDGVIDGRTVYGHQNPLVYLHHAPPPAMVE